jgi:uncharacterized membrane protein
MLPIALAAGTFALCFTDPSGAQQPQKFNARICNQSGDPVAAAVIVRTAANTWRAKGWYGMQNQKCTDLGTYLGPGFFFFAMRLTDQGGSWNGDPNDKDTIWACVFAESFDYDASKKQNCGENVVPFVGWPAGKVPTLQ